MAPQAAEAMLDSCPLGSFQGLSFLTGALEVAAFIKYLFVARELLCASHFIPSFFFRYSYRLMNRSVSSYER